ncbi:transposase [Klebsiella grimontii]|uniref:Transposase n=1 Tax=Klebsiella grimontii TaxID=2058152 RepID=A0A7H4P8T9_9ENTR|nr:transposase [Klebsiella grimontii]
MLTQKEVARDFLQLYLPAPFLSICDLNTLQLASGSFIEEDLRSSDSDILYSLQTRHGAGYIYALIEHQSSPDKLMAFRLIALYAAGGIHGKTRATHSRTGEAVAQATRS